MDKTIYIKTDEEVRIAFDPYRMRIIEVYFIRKIPMTSKQVADILSEHHSKVNYHVKKLLSYNFLELAYTKNIHGFTANYYKLKYDNILIDKEVRQKSFINNYRDNSRHVNHRIYSAWFQDDMFTADDLQSDKSKYDGRDVRSFYQKVYMTEEERNEYVRVIEKFLEEFKNPDENKNEYGVLNEFAITKRKNEINK